MQSKRLMGRASAFLRGRYETLAWVLDHPLNRGSKFHALRDYILWNAARFALDADYVLHMPEGVELLISRRENYATSVYIHSLPDFKLMLFLTHLLRSGDLFADVGANVGMYSTWIARSTGAQVVAIEPVAQTYTYLRRNIRLNELDALIEPIRTAVGDVAGEAMISTANSGLNHIVFEKTSDSESTPIMRLDDIFASRCPTAMKIDVEGFESRVLAGATSILQKAQLKAIVIETKDDLLNTYGTNEDAIAELLEKFGFSSLQYNPLERNLHVSTKVLSNSVFVRKDDPDIRSRLSSGAPVKLPGFPFGV